MALTPSENIELNSTAEAFTLLDTISGKYLSLDNCKGSKGTVIMFICNHCPFVIHINPTTVALAETYKQKGISFIAISSNDVTQYPADAPENMSEVATKNKYPFPYLYDETQEVAKAYKATCTPDIFLFTADLKLFYHGQLDEARPSSNIPCTGTDLKEAMELLLHNEPPPAFQKPSFGCSIKWK